MYLFNHFHQLVSPKLGNSFNPSLETDFAKMIIINALFADVTRAIKTCPSASQNDNRDGDLLIQFEYDEINRK